MPEVVYRDIARNKKAYFDYEILEKLEAGIELRGTEIKSVREGKVNLSDSFVAIKRGEAYVNQMSIAPYDFGNRFNHEERRTRKLLLHKKELEMLTAQVAEKGLTIVPLKMYLKGRHAKLQIAVVRGKKLYDKRATLRENDVKREMDRTMKNYNRR